MSDPTAMEADKTKEEMTMATIIKQTKEEINWAEIARAREMGVLDKLLAEWDVIRFHLRSGTEVAIMVEKVEPGRVWMGFVDGVAERPMYNRLERPVSWKESDARKWCNSDLVQDLPEDLVSIITPRTIRQTIKGEELVTTDLLCQGHHFPGDTGRQGRLSVQPAEDLQKAQDQIQGRGGHRNQADDKPAHSCGNNAHGPGDHHRGMGERPKGRRGYQFQTPGPQRQP